MNDMRDVDHIINSYKEREIERGLTEKLRKNKNQIIDKSDLKEFKLLKDGKESYIFTTDQEIKCEIRTEDKVEKGRLVLFLEEIKKLEIYSKNITEESGDYIIKFKMGPLYLDESRYTISVYLDGEKVSEGLELEIKKGEKKFADHIVVRDPMEEGKFPKGHFYAFGDVENILEDYETGRSICVYSDYIDAEKIKEKYDKAKIIEKE